MAKNLFLITVGLVVGLAIGSTELVKMASFRTPDFRAARWGMTPEEVKRAEALMKPSEETNSRLSYEDTKVELGGEVYAVTLNYHFLEGRLAGGCYDLNPGKHAGVPRFLITFDVLDAALMKSLGEKASGHRELDPDRWRDLLSTWNVGRTKVELRLRTPSEESTAEIFHLCYVVSGLPG